MPLSREQVLLTAGILALVNAEPKHVATAEGVAYYHMPIGSLIIAHPYVPDLDTESRKLVYAGNHSWSVPKAATVWVPKLTNMDDDVEAQQTHKYVTLGTPGSDSRMLILHKDGVVGDAGAISPASWHALESSYKKVKNGELKIPVTVNGKLYGWAPSDWKLYGKPPGSIVYAKSPDGDWHAFTSEGNTQMSSASGLILNQALNNNGLVDYVPEGASEHPPPSSEAPAGPAPGKVNIGGVAVTGAEIGSAINILHNDQSTAVKQPLKSKGHPLQHMDYHGVATAEVKAHPELKVPKGSKDKHVGQVKVAVLHHLTKKQDELHATHAEAAHAADVQAKAKADAEHAQAMTPSTFELGGSEFNKEEIQNAIDALEATKSSAIAQTLKSKHSPLAKLNYWDVVKAHKKVQPDHSKEAAKQAFIHHLQKALGHTTTEDISSGHDDAKFKADIADKQKAALGEAAKTGKLPGVPEMHSVSQATPEPVPDTWTQQSDWQQLHNLVTKGELDPAKSASASHAVALGMKAAASTGKAQYIWKAGPTTYTIMSEEPQHDPVWLWKVEPNHKATTFEAGQAHDENMAAVLMLAKGQLTIPPKEEKNTVPVIVNGQEIGKVPKGSEIYKHKSPTIHTLWIRKPDGTWVIGSAEQMKLTEPSSQTGYYSSVVSGNLIPFDAPYTSASPTSAAPPAPSASPPPYQEIAKVIGQALPQYKDWATNGPGHADWAEALTGALVYSNQEKVNVYVSTYGTKEWKAQYGDKEFGLYGNAKSGETNWRVNPNGTVTHLAGPGGGTTNNDVTSSVLAAVKAHLDSQKPQKVADPPVTFMVNGSEQTADPGSKIYHSVAQAASYGQDKVPFKYIKKPDGNWYSVGASGNKLQGHSYDDQLNSGVLAEDSAAPSSMNQVLSEQAKAEKDKAEKDKWLKQYEQGLVTKAEYKEQFGEDPPEADKTPIEQAVDVLKNGAIPTGVARQAKGQNALDWFLANAAVQAMHPSQGGYAYGTGYVYQDGNGNWEATTHQYGVNKSKTHYKLAIEGGVLKVWKYEPSEPVQPGLAGQVHQSPVPDQVMLDAIGKYVKPNSAHVAEQASKYSFTDPTAGKVYKYGHYYKPKGKAHLEIGPSGGGNSYYNNQGSKYTYWNAHGEPKDVSLNYAVKALQTSTDYSEEPKDFGALPPAKPAPKKFYATSVNVPAGSSQGLSLYLADGELGSINLYEDGTSVVYSPGVGNDSASAQATDVFLKSGTVVDNFNTTVVKPGITPTQYYVFGNEPKTQQEMQSFITDLEQATGDLQQIKQTLLHHIPKQYTANNFINEKAKNTDANGQATALLALLHNLVDGPQETAAAAPEDVKYLKGLPEGISSAHDVFSFDGEGHAALHATMPVYPGSYTVKPFYDLTATDLADKIKAISAKYGGGKVIGTHPSGLTKTQKAAWLHQFMQGDMAAVFSLDASTGKVSPAHPGAPDNPSTHHIDWAPLGSGQVPAAKEIEGEWTNPDFAVIPTAEVDNYLIKAGLQHAEWLSGAERRQWVAFHRAHNQQGVDMITALADERQASSALTQTDAPKWTDNIKPAKSYDAYIDEKTAAGNWTTNALTDFVADNPEVQSFIDSQENDYNYYDDQYKNKLGVQAYLDSKEAEVQAEKLKPVYKLTPGAKPPKATHPIHEIEDQFGKHYFFKPTPASEKFLAEQEDAAGKLGNLWGYKTPESKLIEFGGEFGQAQEKLKPEGDMSFGASLGFYDKAPVPWGDFTDRQLSDVAKEHVLDWALGNDDGRASNFLRMPDGSIVGIDKGRAWAPGSLSWPGLSGDSTADQRSAQVVTGMYAAIKDHSISKDTSDKAFLDVIQQTKRMQRLPDAKLTTLLEQAFANRPGDSAKLVKDFVARKNKLTEDFTALWTKVYADAHWTLPEIPVAHLPQTRRGDPLHSGFGAPELLDHVESTDVNGVPVFFGGPELEDQNFLVWREFQGAGTDKPVLRGESGTHGEAYDKLVGWAKEHQTSGPANAAQAVIPDIGGVKGEADWYHGLIEAAKTISYHNQNGNQEYNPNRIKLMTDAEEQIKTRLTGAEEALAAGPSSDKYAQFAEQYGQPPLVADASHFYLDQIGQVKKAQQDASIIFQPGTLPQWEVPQHLKDVGKTVEEVKEQPKIKVELKSAKRLEGITHTVNGAPTTLDNEGHLHTQTGAINYPGNVWHVQLPTGEEIEIWNGNQTGVALAHHGRIRFRANHEDGAASLERIRAQLQDMGLEMKDAQEHDLELFYWRHLAHILADRRDAQQGKYAKVWDSLKEGMTGSKLEVNSNSPESMVATLEHAGLDPESELEMWHSAWGHVTSPQQIEEFTAAGGHLPHLPHGDLNHPEVAAGDPYWMRFDITPEDILNQQMPKHNYTNNEHIGTVNTIRAGATLPSEERIRRLGADIASGMGNPPSRGATNMTYTRQNLEGSSPDLLFNPAILARTQTYAFNSDLWGELSKRHTSSYFSFAKSSANGDHGNEADVKNALTVLDDIELMKAHSETQRQALIKELHDRGITEIRGLPVEQRIVTSMSAQARQIVKANMAKNMDHINW